MTQLVHGLVPAQWELIADRTSHIIGVSGGVGSAKTHGGFLKALDLAIVNAPVPVLFAEPTYKQVKKAAIPTFREILIDWGLWKRSKLNRQELELTIPINGVEANIWFVNASDEDSLAGSTVGAAVIDEAGLDDIPELAARQIRKRVRHRKAKQRQVVSVGTPDLGKRGWFYDWHAGDPPRKKGVDVRKTERGFVFRWPTRRGSVMQLRYIRARTAENYFNPADYLDAMLEGMDEVNRRRYEDGEFIDLYGRVYTQYDEERHNKASPDPSLGQQVMCCDFGSNIMCWGFGQYFLDDTGENEIAWITGEQVLTGKVDTLDAGRQAARFLSERYSAWYGRRIDAYQAAQMTEVYCDPAGANGDDYDRGSLSDVRILQELGFNVFHRKRHPRVRNRVNAVQRKFQRDEFFIDGAEAPYIERCFRLQGYDSRGQPEKWRGRDGMKGLDHGADAGGYWLEFKWKCDVNWNFQEEDVH